MNHSVPNDPTKASSGIDRKNDVSEIWLAWAAIDARFVPRNSLTSMAVVMISSGLPNELISDTSGSSSLGTSPAVTADSIMRRSASRSEEHTSELQSLMRISYAVFCLKKKKKKQNNEHNQK